MSPQEIGMRGDVLISLVVGVWAIYMGTKLQRTNPERTVTLGRPFRLHRLLFVCGILITLSAVLRLFAR